jgi:hypothetical protein
MKASQDAFYGNERWLKEPRTAIIGRIKTSVRSVITLPETVIEGMRWSKVYFTAGMQLKVYSAPRRLDNK